MQKTPVYIGVFAIDPKGAAKDLRKYSKQCIQDVLGRVNSLYVNQDFNNFEQVFSFPKDNHHITTLYTGGNTKALKPEQQKILNNFKHDSKAPIKIQLCLYVPGVIVVGYSPQLGEITCLNKYPHVTLMLAGDTKPVESNDVIQLAMKQNPNLLEEQFEVKQMKTKYKGKFIYVIKKEITIGGITGDNYRYGSRK